MKEEIEKTPLLLKVRAMREEIKEKDRHIQKQNATISAMKEQTRSEIQFVKEEIEKTPLLRKVRAMREEIGKRTAISRNKMQQYQL